MSHDFSTGWTTAFICGDGTIIPRDCDVHYGNQLTQIMTMIKSSIRLWSYPTFLPTLLLGNYCQRIETRTWSLEMGLLKSEDGLGVTIAGGAGINAAPQGDWLENINARRYSSFLKELDEGLLQDQSLKLNVASGIELRQRMMFITSSLDSMHGFFSGLQERAQTQINVLFSVISQQDGLINCRDNRLNISIAASSKRDSIAMMTFTFIIALFLPGAYISSLFSMSMFNWQTTASNSGSHPSGYFWVYWAVTIPLTLVTLGGWYIWYQYADQKWNQAFQEGLGYGNKASRANNGPSQFS
ncbi:hypothetical protein AOQ84DRAFT_375108 [Glonium stellatum]|uniref:Uncharacterized protein n=1 Tax=Glonium stellatum TaxID=574774 RepID=A0A8E2JV07_9PEZI|nr:hypothetical protein AOQ84DRAFT_375108 [Glonium stellatum]